MKIISYKELKLLPVNTKVTLIIDNIEEVNGVIKSTARNDCVMIKCNDGRRFGILEETKSIVVKIEQ